MEEMAGAVYNRENIFEWTGGPDIPVEISQRCYTARLTDRIIAYDSRSHEIQIFSNSA